MTDTPTDTDLDALVALKRLCAVGASSDECEAVDRLIEDNKALRAENARLREENEKLREPDWFWDEEDPENGYSDEADIADLTGETAVVLRMNCAKNLPPFWMAATYHDPSGWNTTRHETQDDAIRAVEARTALGEPNDAKG